MCCAAGTDGPGGARDPHPEPSHVQQQTEELQAGSREAGERLCKYSSSTTSTSGPAVVFLFCFAREAQRISNFIARHVANVRVLFFHCRKKHVTAWLSPPQTLLVLCSPLDNPADAARAEPRA